MTTMIKKGTPLIQFFSAFLALTITQSTFAMDSTNIINCQYALPAQISTMQDSTVTQWATYAATHTFTYNYKTYNTAFAELKPCFTTGGWDSFSEAIRASNNLKSLTEQELTVSARVNGPIKLIAQSSGTMEPFWLVRVPINVSYHNDDKRSSKNMTVDMTIKTIPGSPQHFGINQMIATSIE